MAKCAKHTIVLLTNAKQWIMIHISDMVIRWGANILIIIERENGNWQTLNSRYCINNNSENRPHLTHIPQNIGCPTRHCGAEAEYESGIKLTTDLVLTAERRGFYCKDLGKIVHLITAPHFTRVVEQPILICYALDNDVFLPLWTVLLS